MDSLEINFILFTNLNKVRDLLAKNYKNKLELRENPESGVYVKDLSNHIV